MNLLKIYVFYIFLLFGAEALFCAEQEAASITAKQKFEKVKHDPKSYAFRELLISTPVSDDLWVEMSKLYSNAIGSIKDDWLYSINGRNKLLSDDPFEPLQGVFFDTEIYTPKWEYVPEKIRKYIKMYLYSKDYEKAIYHLQKVEDQEKANLYLLFNLASLYEKNGNYEPALQRLEMARGFPLDEATRRLLDGWAVRLEFIMGNYENVEQRLVDMKNHLYDKVLEAEKRYRSETDKARAEEFGFDYLNERFAYAEVLNCLGIIRYKLGKIVLAYDIFDALEKGFPGNFVYSFNKNKIYLEKRRYESTLKNVNKIQASLKAVADYYDQQVVKSVELFQMELAELYGNNRDYFSTLSSYLLTRKGEVLFREKHYQSAMEIFRQSTVLNPSDAVSWYRMGMIAFNQDKFEAAIGNFRKVLNVTSEQRELHKKALDEIDAVFNVESLAVIELQDPKSKKRDEFFQNLSVKERDEFLELRDLISSGRRILKKGEYQRLVKFLRVYINDYPNVLELYYLLGRAYHELNQAGLAKYFYGKALDIDKDHLLSLVGLFYFVCIEKDFVEAASMLKHMKAVAPESHLVSSSEAWMEYQRSNFEKAIELYQDAIFKEPKYGEHHYRLGMTYFRSGLYRFAVHKFDDAIVCGFVYSRAYLFKALAQLKLGEMKSAEKCLLEAAGFGRDNPKIVEFAKSILAKIKKASVYRWDKDREVTDGLKDYLQFQLRESSRELIEFSIKDILSGKTMSVIEKLESQLKKDENNLELRFLLGYLHILIEREDIAEDYFYSSYDRNSHDYRALNSLSEIAFRWGKLDQCMIYWKRMEHVSPLIRFSKELDELADEFKRLISINPRDEWASYHYALLKLHTRKEEEALEELEQALKLSEGRSTLYRNRLKVLQGEILYKLGVMGRRPELVDMGLEALKAGEYRYLDLAERYRKGLDLFDEVTDVIPDDRVKLVSDEEIASLSKSARDGIRNPVSVTVPLRQRSKTHPFWKRVDGSLSKKESGAVLTSYDVFIREQKSSVERQYYPVTAYKPLEEDAYEKMKKESTEFAENLVDGAVKLLVDGKWKECEKHLLDAVDLKPDFVEAYFGLILLYLLDGRYEDIHLLMKILKEFDEYEHLLSIIEAHIYFQTGDFPSARVVLERLPENLKFPMNRFYDALMKIFIQTIEYAPKDFQSHFRLGLMYEITGQWEKAEQTYRAAGNYNGLIPFIAESLVFWGLRERRLYPVKEATKSMYELYKADPKEKWQSLARQIDDFLLNYRFFTY